MPSPSHYDTLGVATGASADEIKKAYRRLARKYHPDVSKETDAEAQFKKVGEAYDVLGDEKKRRDYDLQRTGGLGGYANAGGWTMPGEPADFYDLFFRQKGSAQSTKSVRQGRLEITADMARDGGTVDAILEGEPTLQVKTLKGITWLIEVEIETESWFPDEYEDKVDPRFETQGDNLIYKASVPVWHLALGGFINVPTPTGEVRVKIAAGTKPGQQLRLKGKGKETRGGHGDLLVSMIVDVPPPTTAAQKKAYEALAKAFGAGKS